MIKNILISIISLVFVCNLKADKSADDFFERSIRPVLIERCIFCHGGEVKKGGLRLDSKKAILEGGNGGVIVDNVDVNKSRLIKAIKHDGQLKMPRDKSLSQVEIRAFEKWVALGLPWPESLNIKSYDLNSKKKHWAFIHPSETIKRLEDGINSVDNFIQKKQLENLIKGSGIAENRILMRRLKMDLHGVAPSSSEIADFDNDKSPNAYEKLVDRLLASPRYGERWARHWLDIARYADNKGYVFFEDKNYPWAWTYRDYVINALNTNLPYNQFIIEQIAADQIQLADKKSLSAMGFLTVGGHFMGNTHDVIDDRIDVMTRGLMGLTVSCARCHDHKFDPVPTSDYYSMYGILRSSMEPMVPPLYGSEPSNEEYKRFSKELASKEKKLHEFVHGKHKELVDQARVRAGDYLFAAYKSGNQPPADDFMLLADKGDLNPAMIARWRAFLERMKRKNDPTWTHWHRYSELAEKDFSIAASNLKPLDSSNPIVAKAFASPPKSMKEVAATYGKLLSDAEKQWLSLGTGKPLEDSNQEMIRLALYGPNSPADAPLALDWGFLDLFPDRGTQAEYKSIIKDLETQALKGPARSMVLLDSKTLYDPVVFIRGQPNRIGEKVPRRFLGVLDQVQMPFKTGSGRLDLAKSIASNLNPLTARVFVNHVWAHYFGKGLVSTPGDFGARGDSPTHPELLDWLAVKFIENNWNIKELHKTIVTSSVYKQSSMDNEENLKIDPENKLLWRQNRKRLDFESFHDSVLEISGILDQKMEGPSVPVMGGKNRRAVYGYIDRLDFPSILATFDIPNPASSSVERNFTTVAPQALFLMNGPFVREAARKFCNQELIKNLKSNDEKIEAIISSIFCRKPSDAEKMRIRQFLASSNDRDSLLDLVHGLFLVNEFSFID